ncbi:hypothetical protein T265_04345 [Opisthorchis viverrini]|uniref:DNA repair endonuclease XPF n=1 Tax=Opisthorchis viverrini TaxID=6198 RepID=A0A075AGM6_OPIVI|nr:hypothetical protein T265_04345 [Opisthorchis viverrini]KER28874.1 hypothetical protein T265_04345 [Opisthorchis viverrini]
MTASTSKLTLAGSYRPRGWGSRSSALVSAVSCCRTMHELLEYEASLLLDIHEDSSLLVVAEGLGMDTIVYSTLKLHSDPHNLLLVSNYRPAEARFLSELLAKDDVLHSPGIITAEVNNKEREAIYKRGGVVFVTSRILVVDLLIERMPATLVSGVLILRAHELQEACQENFAIRLLRERNPSIFIKAMSDNAVSLTSGYNHAENIMKQAGIPKLVLWPRFNLQVVSCFAATQPQVEEVRVQLTSYMSTCQSCILDLVKACIRELIDLNPVLNTDELSLENALLPNFDGLIGMYLDPVWHQLTTTSRRLISDIANLRRLLRILIEGDAVSFLNNLEAHRQVAQTANLGISGAQSSGSADHGRRGSYVCPSWFLMDQSDRLLTAARSRVYRNFAEKTVQIELTPKWEALTDILRDIHNSRENASDNPKTQVLVLVAHENSARNLERFLRRGSCSMKRFLINTRDSADDPPPKITDPKVPKLSNENPTEPQCMTLTQMYKKAGANTFDSAKRPDEDVNSDSSSSSEEDILKPLDSTQMDRERLVQELLPMGCRKIRVASRLLKSSHTGKLEVVIWVPPTIAATEEGSSGAFRSGVDQLQHDEFARSFGRRLAYVLDSLQPRHVILYEPRVSWIREIEVHSARRHAQACGSVGAEARESTDGGAMVTPLNVHFMVYENSVEEQRYLTQLRREREAFESLIQLSSHIVIPKDALVPASFQDQGGSDSGQQRQQPRVIVDMREFRSELPALLHRKGLKVEPMTLSVSDYILAPHLCVERKSVSDLIGSLKSGRLYQQCTSMSRHYPNPVLLIEFSLPTKVTGSALARGGLGYRGDGVLGFSLYTGRHSIHSGTELNAHHLLSKLTLLTIHFPNLRLFWSVSPYCTAELFTELKQGRAEPTTEKLPQDGEHLEDHNVEAVDMLLRLPGVSWKNYRRIMKHASTLQELAQCSLEELTKILDSGECATKLYTFLHSDCELLRKQKRDATSTESEPSTSSVSSRRGGGTARGPRLALAGQVKTRRGRGAGKS